MLVETTIAPNLAVGNIALISDSTGTRTHDALNVKAEPEEPEIVCLDSPVAWNDGGDRMSYIPGLDCDQCMLQATKPN